MNSAMRLERHVIMQSLQQHRGRRRADKPSSVSGSRKFGPVRKCEYPVMSNL